MDLALNLQKITIDPDNNIEELIWEKINEHRKTFGKEPDFIIIGSAEYLKLAASTSKTMRYSTNQVLWPGNFMGLEIIVCSEPGISFGFKNSCDWALRLETEKLRRQKL